MSADLYVAMNLVRPRLNSVSLNGSPVRIEPKVMQVLVCLAEHAGDVVEKERLIRTVWDGAFVTDDVLTRAISELRRVFHDDARSPRVIQTIPKVGYRLIAPVARFNLPHPAAEKREGVEPLAMSAAAPESARLAVVPVVPSPAKAAARSVEVNTPRRQPLPLSALSKSTWKTALVAGLAAAMAVVGLALSATRSLTRLPLRAAPPRATVRLVVLPFENLSGDREAEHFSDGITEDTTTQLARLNPQHLAVVGRSSAMTYKHAGKTIDAIGRELDVQYVLEGSVRRAGERVRITAQLIEVRSQAHVWAQSYDRELSDVLGAQSDVASAVTRGIGLQLTPRSPARPEDALLLPPGSSP